MSEHDEEAVVCVRLCVFGVIWKVDFGNASVERLEERGREGEEEREKRGESREGGGGERRGRETNKNERMRGKQTCAKKKKKK